MALFDDDMGDDVLGEMVYRNRWLRIVQAPNQQGISTIASVNDHGHGYIVAIPMHLASSLKQTHTLGVCLYVIHLLMMLVINADLQQES